MAGDDAKTVDNISRFGYELLGENAPIAVASLLGRSLMAGAGMAGGVATIVKGTTGFTVNLAQANVAIVNETGKHHWKLAFKMAALNTIGGRAIENRMEKLKGSGNRGNPFIPILEDALKKRHQSFVKDWVVKKDEERDRAGMNPESKQ